MENINCKKILRTLLLNAIHTAIPFFSCFTGSGPSYDHEMARFKLANNIQELWFYTKSQLKKLNTDAANKVLDDIGHRHRFVFVFSSLPHKFSSPLRANKNHTLDPCQNRQ